MTLSEESSGRDRAPAPYGGVESLGGLVHPHAIEVQEFDTYDLIVDGRSEAEYSEDHVPGAVWLELAQWPGTSGRIEGSPTLPRLLTQWLSRLEREAALLLYGGPAMDVAPLAQALRQQGWLVDVLAGGWPNYRRWVQAALETLPRLVMYRVLMASLPVEGSRLMAVLESLGHQVIDLEGLARWSGWRPSPSGPQPSQAAFEGSLVACLRRLDGNRPVWVVDVEPRLGEVVLPGALVDALRLAPVAEVEIPVSERVRGWIEDDPMVVQDPAGTVAALQSLSPAPDGALVGRWRASARHDGSVVLCESVVGEYLDPRTEARLREAHTDGPRLPPLRARSLAAQDLAEAITHWGPTQGVNSRAA